MNESISNQFYSFLIFIGIGILIVLIFVSTKNTKTSNGKDIVCAAVSSMAITTVNGIISLDESVDYEENNGFLKIRVLKDTDINNKLLDNLVNLLSELVMQYPENIEIRNED